jgi:hypothetical protein
MASAIGTLVCGKFVGHAGSRRLWRLAREHWVRRGRRG